MVHCNIANLSALRLRVTSPDDATRAAVAARARGSKVTFVMLGSLLLVVERQSAPLQVFQVADAPIGPLPKGVLYTEGALLIAVTTPLVRVVQGMSPPEPMANEQFPFTLLEVLPCDTHSNTPVRLIASPSYDARDG